MADYSFGGSDEENAELKKLNAEVVCHHPFNSSFSRDQTLLIIRAPNSWRNLIALKIGKNLSALPNLSRVALTEIRVLNPSLRHETFTTDSLPNFPYSSATGRSMPTWNSLLQGPRPQNWYVLPVRMA